MHNALSGSRSPSFYLEQRDFFRNFALISAEKCKNQHKSALSSVKVLACYVYTAGKIE